MLRRQALRLGIALFAAMSAVSAQYESSLETLSGVVRGRDCTPIEGVSVTATSRATTESQTATTDADGLYSLVLVPGRYKIKVAAPGFPDVTIVFEVVADGPNRLDVSVGPGGLMKCKTAPIDVPFSAALHTGTA